MIQPLEFQLAAAEQIASRFARYMDDRPFRGTIRNPRVVPFFQCLSAITGAGKTVILAEASERIRAVLPVEPIVLWISKGRVVVAQTYANLQPGGKYHHLMASFDVRLLSELRSEQFADARANLYFATVGTFNQRDKENGERLIYRSDLDTAEISTWEALKRRNNGKGFRRPLLVVYDEAHNLTDQQTKLLMELEPDGFLMASATMRLPQEFSWVIGGLRESGWQDADLATVVATRDVVAGGLIKRELMLGGYEASMEQTIDALIQRWEAATRAAIDGALDVRPKAIYVSKTNILEGNAFQRDVVQRPFAQRQAPPILIWRYLVEQKGVDPRTIAVYCGLDFDRNFPPPREFVHFKGGEKDYERFVEGDYRHVIFNQALQEGWDDPACFFCYVDKSMGSDVQVEQIVGRVLRQPGAKPAHHDILNTAHFFVRIDAKGVFAQLIERIKGQLHTDVPELRLVAYGAGAGADGTHWIEPRETREVPKVYRDPSHALTPIAKLIEELNDYRFDGGPNVKGQGSHAHYVQRIGSEEDGELEWIPSSGHNAVLARWIFQRAVMRQFAEVLEVAGSDDQKFDARVEFGSRALAHIEQQAVRVVDEYLTHVRLRQRAHNPYRVGAIAVNPSQMVRFNHSLHEGYSGLNSLEAPFAEALDAARVTWARNPPLSGYGIPLVTRGKTKVFYPDFLVWKGSDVVAIDTTGEHLLTDKTGRKLLAVSSSRPGGRIIVRLVSAGRWDSRVQYLDGTGWTVWSIQEDRELRAKHFAELPDVISSCLEV